MSVTAEKQGEIHSQPSTESVREALSHVVGSDLFARSPQQSKLLLYLCDQVLSGSENELKEYTIAVEAMGLPHNYGQSEASTVRVAIHRLRKRLKTYYDLDGAKDRIEICLSAGEYTPRFCFRDVGHGVLGDRAMSEAGDAARGTDLPAVKESSRTVAVELPRVPEGIESTDLGEKDAVDKGAFSEKPSPSHVGVLAKPRRRWLAGAGVIAALLLVSYIHSRLQRQEARTAKSAEADRSTVAAAPPAVVQGAPVRILAGAKGHEYTDANGNLWSSDRYYKGGEALDIASLRPGNKLPLIRRAGDQALIRHYREGDLFSYEIPVQPGTYDLILGFAETTFGPEDPQRGGENERIFTVKINGNNAIDRLDVYSDAGGPDILDTKRFANVVPSEDGKVHLQFAKTSSNAAILSFIELLPQAGGRINPVRISTRDQGIVDNMGRAWEADTYYLGGRSVVNRRWMSGTSTPELYVGERFGNFSYDIPVPTGRRYRLALYFAERYFGSDKADDKSAGLGARVFDVTCNGTVLLRNFDILKDAGAKDRPIVKTFSGLNASPQGRLSVSFVPSHNYAVVNAIEVTEDAP